MVCWKKNLKIRLEESGAGNVDSNDDANTAASRHCKQSTNKRLWTLHCPALFNIQHISNAHSQLNCVNWCPTIVIILSEHFISFLHSIVEMLTPSKSH